jgi:hypothetical protein
MPLVFHLRYVSMAFKVGKEMPFLKSRSVFLVKINVGCHESEYILSMKIRIRCIVLLLCGVHIRDSHLVGLSRVNQGVHQISKDCLNPSRSNTDSLNWKDHMMLFLRGGYGNDILDHDSSKGRQESEAIRTWANAAPEQRKLFSRFAQEMDEWLRKERGVSLKNSNRSTILECIEHFRQPRERPESQRPPPPSIDNREGSNTTSGRALTVDELNERMWLACQLGDEDIVCQAVADGAEVPLQTNPAGEGGSVCLCLRACVRSAGK